MYKLLWMITKLRLVFSITIFFVGFYSFGQNNYWQTKTLQSNFTTKSLQNTDLTNAKTFVLDKAAFINKLAATTTRKGAQIIYFPNEKGELRPFRVQEHSVFSPELAKKYPTIKSYVGYGVSDKKERIRFSVSHKGVQGMIVYGKQQQSTFLQLANKDTGIYVVYTKSNKSAKDNFLCATKEVLSTSKNANAQKLVDDQILRTYRIAISASAEYTTYHGGTVTDALAAINATLTRVNEVFEVDFGVKLELVANTDQVIYTDAATDPYGGNLMSEAHNTFTSVIGAANYDVGHLFHQGPNGGNAGTIGTVCNESWKGKAYSSRSTPEGAVFDLDFVAHEMGHQFGANHTWSFDSEGTLVQVEPASGTTIMGYAGITDGNNVAEQGDDYFHYYSIFQVIKYLKSISCGTQTPITNNPPVITPLINYIIPKSTAFKLDGSATDADITDVLTYTWEQIDEGVVTTSSFGPNNPSGANFRSLKPTTSSERYMPGLNQVLQGNLTQVNPGMGSPWETVSAVERDLNFALTVRDNVVGGGQVSSETMKVSVVNAAGPFVVTSQATNVVYLSGSNQEIIWDVANTNSAPVNAQTVDIYLSTDAGLTFTTLLAANVVNDGSQTVQMPSVATTGARIMVKASTNIFYALNSANFTINVADVELEFNGLEHTACKPNNIVVPFVYKTNNSFNETSTFSVFGVPAGLGVSFSSNTASVNNTAIDVTFSNTASVSTGTYDITILATSANNTTPVKVTLNINDTNYVDAVLLLPQDVATGINMRGPLVWQADNNYTFYDLQIATDNAFTSIIETTTIAFTSYAPKNLEPQTQYFWRIKPKNNCGEGAFGQAFNFTTILINCTEKSATDLPIIISSVGTSVVQSKITFLDDLLISDINVTLNLKHSYLSDLIVSLISPSGTKVVLTSNSCGDYQDINAVFDDEAVSFVCGDGNGAAINGTVKPLGSLGSFVGESVLGEWILEVKDGAATDGGELLGFSLNVCVEGDLRPDADNDGVFDDGDDACLGTPQGAEVNINGCAIYRFLADNFSIVTKSESCSNADNGEVLITAIDAIDYTVTITGNQTNNTVNFTDTVTLSGLKAGTYTVCVTGTNGSVVYEAYCVAVVITEPDDLGVSFKMGAAGKQVSLELSGAELYNIELNGVLMQTVNPKYTLNLKEGLNTLKVSTGIVCQGVYKEHFYMSNTPVVYPNPASDIVSVYLGVSSGKVAVAIYTVNGSLVQQKIYKISNSQIELNISNLSKGMYIVTFEGDQIKGETKLIKK